MASKKGSSKARKDRLTAYKAENRSLKNRTRKLEAHIKRNPEDAKAIATLKKGVVVYGRKKPHNNMLWSPMAIEYAHTLRLLGYNGKMALTKAKHSDERVAR